MGALILHAAVFTAAFLIGAAVLLRGAHTGRRRVRWNPGMGPHRGPLVYIVRAEGTDEVKVGMTTQTVDERVGGWETGRPQRCVLIGVVTVQTKDEAYRVEARIHRALKRMPGRRWLGKEWFRLPADDPAWMPVIEAAA